jgi:CRP/FNR family cyclic AMP-dependent transcriptional regulator
VPLSATSSLVSDQDIVATQLRAGTPVLPAPELVDLLELDHTFWSAVPHADRQLARRLLSVRRRALVPGPWEPLQMTDGRPRFGLIVLDGAIIQEVVLAGRRSAQLLGPGDLLRPWQQAETALPCSMRWTVVGEAGVAVLDERFVAAGRRWPDLIDAVYGRLSDQLDNGARHSAICGLPRVEDRVLALFWHLADRWGTVRPEGVVIRLPFTHELLGRMIAAKRPTVSLALAALAAEGLLHRDEAGAWTLAHGSRALLEPDGPEPIRAA